MPKITLLAGEEQNIKTSALYLSIIDSTGYFRVEAPQFGSLHGETSRKYHLDGVSEVIFKNDSVDTIDIEFEVANIIVDGGGKGLVSVQNEIVVKRIVEAIQVNASATVEDGKMASNVSNAFTPISAAKISIPAGSTVEVFAARASLNRKVTLQLITDDPNMSEIRIGNSAANTTATKGIFLQGHKDAPSAYQWETETAVFVHNPNASAITLAGGEEWRE